MTNFLLGINPLMLSLIAGLFAYFFTISGSAVVFFFRKINSFFMDIMLSISAGIMLAAAFFSLLNPAVEMVNKMNLNVWINIFLGFLIGCLILFLGNKILLVLGMLKKRGVERFRRDILLFSSITLHNIPEGLVIGVGFGTIASSSNLKLALLSAISLTIGIAIQNFPEGSAISLPLRRDGLSNLNSFLFAALSGIVEPIAAVFGALLVLKIQLLLPFILSLTSGAMFYVVVLELIPESQKNKNNDFMALILLLGFTVMMMMEIIIE